MKYELWLTKKAQKSLERLGPQAKKRINEAFKELIAYYQQSEGLPAPDLKMLKGKYQGLLRLRVGDWRGIFKMEADKFVILVIDVVSRGSAYK